MILADQLPLGINVYNLIAQVITFIILLVVLGKYVFPLLLKTMDQRAATIREGVENAEKSRRELAEAQQRVEALLEQARRDAQASIARATASAEQVRVGIEQDAQKRAQDILTQAERRIQQEVAQARVQLRHEVADLAIQAAEHVVGKSMDQTTSRRLVSEFVAQSDARARDLQC